MREALLLASGMPQGNIRAKKNAAKAALLGRKVRAGKGVYL